MKKFSFPKKIAMSRVSLFLSCSVFLFSTLVLGISAAFAGVNGVSIDWLRSIDGHPEGGDAIASDASNNTYAAGSSGFIYLTKRDRFGNFQWEISSISHLGEIPVNVFVDPQGNAVVVGFAYSSLEEGPFAVSLIVLKCDPSGNLIYKKSIDGSYTYFNNSQNRTRVTAQMDAAGNVYIGTGGRVNGQPDDGFNVVKVSPGGNIAWIRTQTFGGSPFYLVSNIRLKGNKLGLTGPTLYYAGNPGTWVLDTSGTTSWSSISTGFGSADIAMDNNGNSYVLTLLQNIAGASTGSDICLYKFNASGKQTWLKGYDFGSNEGGIRIELTPDNKLVIMADGSQINGGLSYVDWITLKVNLKGELIWSNRYDETIDNDELPYMLLVDTKNNIYVTGNGGPFPGGSNLGAVQGVTVKYSSSGKLLWTALLDTLNFTGVDIAMGTDTSLFVISASASAVVHYLQSNGKDPCSVPVNLSATGITEDAATVQWDAVTNAFLYHVEYKTSTGTIWSAITTDATVYTITGLSLGTEYDYRIEAVCNSGPTGFSPASQFTTLGSGYCISRGLDASKEWIDYVGLNAISNFSGSNGGYADFTSMSADLVQGSTNTLVLRQGMNPGVYTEIWRIWIDYNHDGDFTDNKEKVAGYKSNTAGLVFTSFMVPTTATTGNTRMRISMKKGKPDQTPCEIFDRGEVEDYTVNILPAKIGSAFGSNNSESTIPVRLITYPNPAANLLNVDLSGFDGKATIQVFNVTGQLMETQNTNIAGQLQINIQALPAGLYILHVMDEEGNTSTTKWIKE